jgi:hypothetical protein
VSLAQSTCNQRVNGSWGWPTNLGLLEPIPSGRRKHLQITVCLRKCCPSRSCAGFRFRIRAAGGFYVGNQPFLLAQRLNEVSSSVPEPGTLLLLGCALSLPLSFPNPLHLDDIFRRQRHARQTSPRKPHSPVPGSDRCPIGRRLGSRIHPPGDREPPCAPLCHREQEG